MASQINSENIKVYPAANRLSTYDFGATLNLEQNIVQVSNNIVDNKNYVVKDCYLYFDFIEAPETSLQIIDPTRLNDGLAISGWIESGEIKCNDEISFEVGAPLLDPPISPTFDNFPQQGDTFYTYIEISGDKFGAIFTVESVQRHPILIDSWTMTCSVSIPTASSNYALKLEAGTFVIEGYNIDILNDSVICSTDNLNENNTYYIKATLNLQERTVGNMTIKELVGIDSGNNYTGLTLSYTTLDDLVDNSITFASLSKIDIDSNTYIWGVTYKDRYKIEIGNTQIDASKIDESLSTSTEKSFFLSWFRTNFIVDDGEI